MRLLLALLAAFAALAPATAVADTRDRIIKDCADDGRLQGQYSESELRDARQNLPSDVAEYTDCADVLRRAELPDGSSGGGSAGAAAAAAAGGGGGELLIPADDAERQTLRDAAASGGGPVDVDGQEVVPGAAGLASDARRNGLPASLLGALALLLAAVGAAAYPAVRGGAIGRLFRRS